MSDWLALQGLTEADLAANRAGRITDAQAARIRAEARRRRTVIFGIILVAAAGTCAAIATKAARARDLLVAVPVVFAIDLLFAWLLDRFVLTRFVRELDVGEVRAVEGTLDKVIAAPARSAFLCAIGGTTYQGVQATGLGQAMKVGDTVRLFVLPRSRIILGAEKI